MAPNRVHAWASGLNRVGVLHTRDQAVSKGDEGEIMIVVVIDLDDEASADLGRS